MDPRQNGPQAQWIQGKMDQRQNEAGAKWASSVVNLKCDSVGAQKVKRNISNRAA